MKKLIITFVFALMGLMAFGQTLDSLNLVGSINSRGGDSKKVAYEKINDVIIRQNSSAIITTIVTIDSANIVGNSAGAIGHSAGAILVAAPGAGYALDFISAVLVTDFGVAAYTGGNNDATIRVGTVDHTAALTDTMFLMGTVDHIEVVDPLNAAEYALTPNATINLSGTAFTEPGTATGVLRVHVTYRRITTGL
jgi:hypothetical protein